MNNLIPRRDEDVDLAFLQRQNIDVYVLSTTSVLRATRMVNQASWQKLKLQNVLRIKPRIFSSCIKLIPFITNDKLLIE